MALNDTHRRWGRLSPHRTVLSLLVLGTLGAMAAAAAQKADIANLKPQDIDVAVQPVAFEAADPSRRDFGRLSFRGGLVLSAANPAFGGYSGLSLNADGTEFLAVSDGGSWLSAKLVTKSGQLAGLKEARIGPLTQKGGAPIRNKRDRDAESIFTAGGQSQERRYFIGFEVNHRVEEYEFKDGAMSGPLRRLELPRQLRSMPRNSGLEAGTILKGGAYAGAMVLFAERKLTKAGHHTGSMVKAGKSYPLFLTRKDEYDITELASLADGSLLVLERSFLQSSLRLDIRLRLIPAADIKPDAVLEGTVLLEADQRYRIDNFEAMDVAEDKDGEALITLMSDDNFSFFQSTLLLQFALKRD
jgi:hypothetical protein